MAYATISDVRGEGLSVSEASDLRVEAMLEEASEMVDRACGWWFDARATTLVVSGNGGKQLELPVPPVNLASITSVLMDEAPIDLPLLTLLAVPIMAQARTLCVSARSGLRWYRGVNNIQVVGTFGVQPGGKTPSAVRRATLMLALKLAPKLTSQDAGDARNRWRLLTEQTRDQSYTMAERVPDAVPMLTGDPEVDEVLAPWARPMFIGGA